MTLVPTPAQVARLSAALEREHARAEHYRAEAERLTRLLDAAGATEPLAHEHARAEHHRAQVKALLARYRPMRLALVPELYDPAHVLTIAARLLEQITPDPAEVVALRRTVLTGGAYDGLNREGAA